MAKEKKVKPAEKETDENTKALNHIHGEVKTEYTPEELVALRHIHGAAAYPDQD